MYFGRPLQHSVSRRDAQDYYGLRGSKEGEGKDLTAVPQGVDLVSPP